MNTKPILFTGEMVRAIIDGRKTQSRRVIKTRAENHTRIGPVGHQAHIESPEALNHCPYGVTGDLLWVRETWRELGSVQQEDGRIPDGLGAHEIIYRADDLTETGPWRPSIFLPRSLSRLTLRVSNVRVERVQDIGEEDCQAEGCTGSPFGPAADLILFPSFWDSINAKRGYSYESNPWVWVIEWDKMWTQNVDKVLL